MNCSLLRFQTASGTKESVFRQLSSFLDYQPNSTSLVQAQLKQHEVSVSHFAPNEGIRIAILALH